MKVLNTMYRKPLSKTATYRLKKQITPGQIENISAETHEQLDYIITPRRWRNTVSNAESNSTANIDSDHFPVIADINK